MFFFGNRNPTGVAMGRKHQASETSCEIMRIGFSKEVGKQYFRVTDKKNSET